MTEAFESGDHVVDGRGRVWLVVRDGGMATRGTEAGHEAIGIGALASQFGPLRRLEVQPTSGPGLPTPPWGEAVEPSTDVLAGYLRDLSREHFVVWLDRPPLMVAEEAPLPAVGVHAGIDELQAEVTRLVNTGLVGGLEAERDLLKDTASALHADLDRQRIQIRDERQRAGLLERKLEAANAQLGWMDRRVEQLTAAHAQAEQLRESAAAELLDALSLDRLLAEVRRRAVS